MDKHGILMFLHYTSLVWPLFHVLFSVCLRMYQYSFQAHEFLKQKNLVKQGMAIYFLKF
jgi:hypothetical protein